MSATRECHARVRAARVACIHHYRGGSRLIRSMLLQSGADEDEEEAEHALEQALHFAACKRRCLAIHLNACHVVC